MRFFKRKKRFLDLTGKDKTRKIIAKNRRIRAKLAREARLK